MSTKRMGRKRRKKLRSAAIRRRNLWLANPCCHWCGKETSLPEIKNQSGTSKVMATVDHLYSRYHSLPSADREAQTVLACLPCNSKRCRKENLVFRDFIRTLDLLGRRGMTNRQKVQAFRDALTMVNGRNDSIMPDDADGQAIALVFLRVTGTSDTSS